MYEDDYEVLNRPQPFERPVATNCPASADLILASLGSADDPGDKPPRHVGRHVSMCAECGARLTALREVVLTLRTEAPERLVGGACLDPHDVARLVDGADPGVDGRAIAHLASCGDCRSQLAAALRLVRDPAVAGEIERLETPRFPAQRRSRFALAGSLAAAVLVGTLLWPDTGGVQFGPGPAGNTHHERATENAVTRRVSPAGAIAHTDSPVSSSMPGAERYRERTITTTAAPRIIAPVGRATSTDSLVWTSVPGADLYRITFWRPDGTVVWEGEARDTALALPARLSQSGEGPLLWEVRARTGWDRWVVSELVETTLDSSEGISK